MAMHTLSFSFPLTLTHTHTHIIYTVFPRLRLWAVIFPKVSSCGPCARQSGELWRGWRRLACWMKKPVTFAFRGTATSFLSSPFHLSCPISHLPCFSSWGGLPAETGRLILPCYPPLLYPSDKALCFFYSSRRLSFLLWLCLKKR